MDKLSSTQTLPFCATQSVGRREEQEDSYGIVTEGHSNSRENPSVFILAAGMGGHTGGAMASQLVIDSVKTFLVDSGNDPEQDLFDAMLYANRKIGGILEEFPTLKGMGSTLIISSLTNGIMRWISIGDSMLCGVSKECKVVRLNEDHSMKPVLDLLVAEGTLSEDDDQFKNDRNQLRSALQGGNIKLYDLNDKGVAINKWKYFILASDGLDTISYDDMGAIIKKTESNGIREIAEALIEGVHQEKNDKQDNVTIIVLDAKAYSYSRPATQTKILR